MTALRVPTFGGVEELLRATQPEEPVTCVWPRRLAANASRFLSGFPGWVAYAVKANPEPAVLMALHAAGVCHFDVASEAEIALARRVAPDAELFFHNPVKSRRSIREAYQQHGVRRFVVDHQDELSKVLEEVGGRDVVVLIRVAVSGEAVAQDFSTKFGTTGEGAIALLVRAARAGVGTGLAFHLGTQCADPDGYGRALRLCGELLSRSGVVPSCLSVGGGFPAYYQGQRLPPLGSYFRAIEQGFAPLRSSGCALMCEPGRALVADGCTLLVRVRLRRGNRLFIADGPTGSFGDFWYQGRTSETRLHRLSGPSHAAQDSFILEGPLAPECDDELPGHYLLPADVREGDWIEFGEVGAYGAGMASDLQRYNPVPCVKITEEPEWMRHAEHS
jgi:ornithine decarboxylase